MTTDTTHTPDPNSILMGSGAPAIKFDQIGTTVSGTVVTEPEAKQQTDFRTKLPETWKDGSPKMQVIVRLATALRDPQKADDDGERNLYIKGRELTNAIRNAVRASGANGIHTGGQLVVSYVGDGPAEPGMNPPKLYAAQYVPPAVSFNGIAGPATVATSPAAPVQQQIPVPAPAQHMPAAPMQMQQPAAASVVGALQRPDGVDPGMWAALTPEQQRAVIAATPAQQPGY